MGSTYQIITKTDELEKFCKEISNAELITIDTEFVRERTYFPQLCLIQVASTPDKVALVDPIQNKDLDLTSLFKILKNNKIIKIFHAASQDLEIFANIMDGDMPTPIFDTQIAAMFCGHGDQISYGRLVEHYCDQTLNKDSQYANWAKRPLTEKQLDYAAADVTYLHTVYKGLVADLKKANRLDWALEEMSTLHIAENYLPAPDEVWKKIKIKTNRPLTLGYVHAIAKWREETAIHKDLPKQRVLRDNTIAEIAMHPPKSPNDFNNYRGKDAKGNADKIIKLCRDVEKLDESQLPTQKKKKPLRDDESNLLDILKLTLKLCARENDLVPRLIVSNDDLERMARGKNDVPSAKGWRYNIFGKQAELILNGKEAIALDDKKNLKFIKAS